LADFYSTENSEEPVAPFQSYHPILLGAVRFLRVRSPLWANPFHRKQRGTV
jgi:hypothetical protein